MIRSRDEGDDERVYKKVRYVTHGSRRFVRESKFNKFLEDAAKRNPSNIDNQKLQSAVIEDHQRGYVLDDMLNQIVDVCEGETHGLNPSDYIEKWNIVDLVTKLLDAWPKDEETYTLLSALELCLRTAALKHPLDQDDVGFEAERSHEYDLSYCSAMAKNIIDKLPLEIIRNRKTFDFLLYIWNMDSSVFPPYTSIRSYDIQNCLDSQWPWDLNASGKRFINEFYIGKSNFYREKHDALGEPTYNYFYEMMREYQDKAADPIPKIDSRLHDIDIKFSNKYVSNLFAHFM